MSHKYRSNFSEIIVGYSKVIWRNQEIFFKHFNNLELGFFEKDEEYIYQKTHNKGLSTEKEKLEFLKIDNIWTENQERELRQEKEFLDSQIITKKNLLLDSQIKNINQQIEKSEKKIYDIILARNQLIGFTVENFTSRKMNELHMSRATYKDSNLSQLFFTVEEFNELEDNDLEELINLYNNKLDFLNKNIKKLALSTFFQNMFRLSPESIFEFYGKPVITLTILQQDLYIYGRFFSNILQEENKPSQEMLDDPDKLIENYQKNQNLKESIGEQKGNLSGGTILGASKREMDNAGVKGRRVDFRKRLKEGQSELSSIELARIFQGQ